MRRRRRSERWRGPILFSLTFTSRRCINSTTAKTLLISAHKTLLNTWHLFFFFIQFCPHAVWWHFSVASPVKSHGRLRQLWCTNDAGCASRCFFLSLCHRFLGWFLRIVSVFQSLNSLKQSLFFQADSVKHNWHFGAVEYTCLTFTQASNAISALCWLDLPPRRRPSDTHWHFSDWESPIPNSWHLCHIRHALPLQPHIWKSGLHVNLKWPFFNNQLSCCEISQFKNKQTKTLPRCWKRARGSSSLRHWLWDKCSSACAKGFNNNIPSFVLFLPPRSSFFPVWFWLLRCRQHWQGSSRGGRLDRTPSCYVKEKHSSPWKALAGLLVASRELF